MKKAIAIVFLFLFTLVLAAQEQEKPPVLPDNPPQAESEAPPAPPEATPQAEEPKAQLPAPPQGRDLKRIRIPQPFVHAGKEYPAGIYWMVLAEKDGAAYFAVQNDKKEPLFEDLAIAKERRTGRTGSGFWVNKGMTHDGEYFRVKVTTPGQWLFGYFLLKK